MNIKFALAKLKYVQVLLIVLLAALAARPQSDAPFSIDTSPLPPSTGFVNDYAGVFDAAAKQQLESRLADLKTKTGVEIAVAVVGTTAERDIFDYSLAVARGWKIGSKEDDNPSALLFVAIEDRKYFTHISRDLEDELPDGVAGSLQRQYLVPEFRQRNYAKGIADTVDAYIRTIESKRSGVEAPPAANTEPQGKPTRRSSLTSGLCCLIIIGIILLVIWNNRRGGRSGGDDDSWGGGGGLGGALPWIIGSMIANSARSSSGSSWGGGGSDWGGSSGGGGGWGGFGGGGDFGGGGAGGDW